MVTTGDKWMQLCMYFWDALSQLFLQYMSVIIIVLCFNTKKIDWFLDMGPLFLFTHPYFIIERDPGSFMPVRM